MISYVANSITCVTKNSYVTSVIYTVEPLTLENQPNSIKGATDN